MVQIKVISISKIPFKLHEEIQQWIKNRTYQDYKSLTISQYVSYNMGGFDCMKWKSTKMIGTCLWKNVVE